MARERYEVLVVVTRNDGIMDLRCTEVSTMDKVDKYLASIENDPNVKAFSETILMKLGYPGNIGYYVLGAI